MEPTVGDRTKRVSGLVDRKDWRRQVCIAGMEGDGAQQADVIGHFLSLPNCLPPGLVISVGSPFLSKWLKWTRVCFLKQEEGEWQLSDAIMDPIPFHLLCPP